MIVFPTRSSVDTTGEKFITFEAADSVNPLAGFVKTSLESFNRNCGLLVQTFNEVKQLLRGNVFVLPLVWISEPDAFRKYGKLMRDTTSNLVVIRVMYSTI